MKVKATAAMRKFLAESIPEYTFRLEKMTLDEYQIFVDYDVLRNTTDWRSSDNKMQVIKVIYPPEYYAIPGYITTRNLISIFNNSDGTAADFIRAARNEIAI